MWLGTEQDVAKLYVRVEKFSLPGIYDKESKKEIVQETMIRMINWARNYDVTLYGEPSWSSIMSKSFTCFKQATTDFARREKYYRGVAQDDTFTENQKLPAIQYLQTNEKAKGAKVKSFYISSFKESANNTLEKKHAYDTVTEVINKELAKVINIETADFLRLSLWHCNKGYSLSELAEQAEFDGNPVIERGNFITDVDFILNQAYQGLSLILVRPKSIQIQRDVIDTCDSEGGETTIFSVLPDLKPNPEKSAYILEVYKLLKTVFDKQHKRIQNPNKANFIYLSFWSLTRSKLYEVAAECGYETKNASQDLSRFTKEVSDKLKDYNLDLFIDTFEGRAEVLSNNEFSGTEIDQLFSHELESQVNDDE